MIFEQIKSYQWTAGRCSPASRTSRDAVDKAMIASSRHTSSNYMGFLRRKDVITNQPTSNRVDTFYPHSPLRISTILFGFYTLQRWDEGFEKYLPLGGGGWKSACYFADAGFSWPLEALAQQSRYADLMLGSC